MSRLTIDELVGFLRSALHHLDDPVFLRRSPLVELLGLASEFDKATALQQLLTEAICTLKPAEHEPPQSKAWQIYNALSLQHLQQVSRLRVASQLGVSERQLRRERRLALETLAQYICKHHGVNVNIRHVKPIEEPALQILQPALSASETCDAEISWLINAIIDQRCPLEDVLQTVQSLAYPLAQSWQTQLQLKIEGDVAGLPVIHHVTRDILLFLLSVAIPRSGPGLMILTAARRGQGIEIVIVGSNCFNQAEPFSCKENARLDAARQWAAYHGAHLAISCGAGALRVGLTLPPPQRIPVLVVDDNPDWLALLRRYAIGSRYEVLGTQEPDVARILASKLQPAVIFMDVTMPHIDSRQIVYELRKEKTTTYIPIVACSPQPLENWTQWLGINAFVQKPITQPQFLSVVGHQIGAVE